MSEENYRPDILIYDVNNLFYRSYAALDYATDDGTDISGIFGTFNTVSSVISRFNPKMAVLVYDGKGGSKKKRAMYSEYKAGRKLPVKSSHPVTMTDLDRKENFTWQLKKVYDYFASYLPLVQVIVEGYEADELIGHISNKLFTDKTKLIISSDKDFFQLVNDKNVNLYSHTQKTIISESDVLDAFNSLGSGAAIVKSILGDSSDNIKTLSKLGGFKNLGEKTLAKMFPTELQNPNITLDEFLELCKVRAEEETLSKPLREQCQNIVNAKDLLQKNYDIVQLNDVDLSLNATMEVRDSFVNIKEDNLPFDFFGLKKQLFKDGIPIPSKEFTRWQSNFLVLKSNTKKFSAQLKQELEEEQATQN